MNKEELNKNYVLNKTYPNLQKFIKKIDFLFFIKNPKWIRIIYFIFIPFLIGLIVFTLYTSTHYFPYQEPEWSAFKLTLLIIIFMELSFVFGFLIIECRKSIKRDLNANFESLNNSFVICFLKVTIISIIISILSAKVCYEFYAFFVVNPPVENLGFGGILIIIMILVFLFTFLLGILAIYLKQKV